MIKFKSVKKKEVLYHCPVCGSEGDIYDYVSDDGTIDGLGDVGCSKEIDRMSDDRCESKKFHYGGDIGRTKKEAIGMWNEYVINYNQKKER